MSLRRAQSDFARALAELILWATDHGYEITLGDAYRDPRAYGDWGATVAYGHPRSAHKRRLAADLNLFRDGAYLARTDEHLPLGEWWEARGGLWGGRFEDGNHYEWPYQD